MTRSNKRRPPHSSAKYPYPVVIPPERRNIETEMITSLKKDCKSLISKGSLATHEKIHAFYTDLMDATFLFLGVDRSKYSMCFAACRDLCKTTNVYKANNWSNWDGLQGFMRTMEKVDRLTRHSNLLHCPAAPGLMVVIALEQIVLHGRISGRSKISDFLRDFDCYNKAVSAISYHQIGNRQPILTLSQPWDLTARVQCSPTRLIDQSETITSENGALMSSGSNATRDAAKLDEEPDTIKIESSPECQAGPASEPQPALQAIQQAGVHDALQNGPLFTSPFSSNGVHQVESNILHQAASHSMNQSSSPAMRQAASHAMLQAGQPAMNQYISPFEHQNTLTLARQAAELRERGRERPMPIYMPRQESSTMRETYVQVSRADVMEALQPLFGRLKYEDWTGRVQDDIMRVLTEKSVKVITGEAKGMLGLWAGRTNNGVVLSWLDQAQEDLTVFQWIERHDKPNSMMWYSDHFHTIFHDLDVTIATVSEPTVRDQLRAQVSVLRDTIFTQQ